jgi:hypothetical protein
MRRINDRFIRRKLCDRQTTDSLDESYATDKRPIDDNMYLPIKCLDPYPQYGKTLARRTMGYIYI